jgi:hypothetical protein
MTDTIDEIVVYIIGMRKSLDESRIERNRANDVLTRRKK